MTVRSFQTGTYRHYKGGLYMALGLVSHHETRKEMVVYVSQEYGSINVRPLHGWPADPDGWSDFVEHEGRRVRRFEFVKPFEADKPFFSDVDPAPKT